jgi:hypothetical protein
MAGGKDWVVPSPEAHGAARALRGVLPELEGRVREYPLGLGTPACPGLGQQGAVDGYQGDDEHRAAGDAGGDIGLQSRQAEQGYGPGPRADGMSIAEGDAGRQPAQTYEAVGRQRVARADLDRNGDL